MSTPHTDRGAVAPQRERGRLRVQAILDAAAAVISEKGFAAATMTEIAARANTAIGSLYRFFPTKDVLADALSQRFLADLGERLDEIAARADHLPAPVLADALLDLMSEMRRGKTAALALMEVMGDAEARRAGVRERMQLGLSAILRTAAPKLDEGRREAAAAMVLHFLRGIRRLSEGDAAPEPKLSELRLALSLYLGRLVDQAPERASATGEL